MQGKLMGLEGNLNICGEELFGATGWIDFPLSIKVTCVTDASMNAFLEMVGRRNKASQSVLSAAGRILRRICSGLFAQFAP